MNLCFIIAALIPTSSFSRWRKARAREGLGRYGSGWRVVKVYWLSSCSFFQLRVL